MRFLVQVIRGHMHLRLEQELVVPVLEVQVQQREALLLVEAEGYRIGVVHEFQSPIP